MENKTLISVCVPVYGVEKYIEKCARSLFEQTLQDGVEFIFVNDCSPDNSISILENILAEYPIRQAQVKILHNKENLGLARTRFVALDAARGKYIWHCDSDDWVEPDMLEKMLAMAEKTDADIVCCNAVVERYHENRILTYPYSIETKENGLQELRNTEAIFIAIWNKLIKKSLYTDNDIRFYPGVNMGEDSALTYRLRYYSKKTVIISQCFYHYNRQNVNSMCASNYKSADQYITLAKHLEHFFYGKTDKDKYFMLVNAVKFNSKKSILTFDNNYSAWKSIFPETHKYIFSYSGLSLWGRIKWFSIAYLPFVSLCFRLKKAIR